MHDSSSWTVISFSAEGEKFYNQEDAKGGGGEGTGLLKVKTQIMIVRGSPKCVTLRKFKGLLRYHKPHVTDYIAIYAFAYNTYIAAYIRICAIIYSVV